MASHMKERMAGSVKAPLLKGAFYLLLLLPIPLALGYWQARAPSQNQDPTTFVCPGCPIPRGWLAGPEFTPTPRHRPTPAPRP